MLAQSNLPSERKLKIISTLMIGLLFYPIYIQIFSTNDEFKQITIFRLIFNETTLLSSEVEMKEMLLKLIIISRIELMMFSSNYSLGVHEN